MSILQRPRQRPTIDLIAISDVVSLCVVLHVLSVSVSACVYLPIVLRRDVANISVHVFVWFREYIKLRDFESVPRPYARDVLLLVA